MLQEEPNKIKRVVTTKSIKIASQLFIILVLSANLCWAQRTDLGSWNIINVKYNMNEKWSVFGEAQLRSLKFYNHFHYHEFKGGLEYKVHNRLN